MAAAERNKTEYRERLDRTVQFMYRLNLPPKIQNRVRMWFTYNWSMQKTLGEDLRHTCLTSDYVTISNYSLTFI